MTARAVPTATTDQSMVAEAVRNAVTARELQGMRSQRRNMATNDAGSLLSCASLLGVAVSYTHLTLPTICSV